MNAFERWVGPAEQNLRLDSVIRVYQQKAWRAALEWLSSRICDPQEGSIWDVIEKELEEE